MRWLLVALGLLFTALPGAATAEAATYRLQAGDSISVSVWQDPKLDRQLIVGPDGMISFPLVGQVRAGGQTLQAVETALRKKLQASYKTDLDVTVALSALGTENPTVLYITGEVNKPGAQPFVSPINVLQAIALAGGFSPYAATRRIEIYRTTKGRSAKFTFNYRDYESGRDLSGNIDLSAGDVVVVPEKGLFGF